MRPHAPDHAHEGRGTWLKRLSDGADGLEKMSKAEFDFILCDLRMPKMDGMAF